MKFLKKIMCCMILCLLVTGRGAAAKTTSAASYSLKNVTKATVIAGNWVTQGTKVRFQKEDGTFLKSRWLNYGGKIYYLNKSGVKTTGWVKYRSKMYYLKKTGELMFGWLNNKYYLQADGSRASGLKEINGESYYFNKTSGKKKTGWIKIGKYQYYFDKKTGRMVKNAWVYSSKNYYYVSILGRKVKSSWVTLNGKKYYLDADGIRVTGTYFIGTKGYYFKANGEYDPTVKVKAEVDVRKPMVALTFDDGPGPYTNRLLNCLQKNNAKATFFMVGSNVGSYKRTVRRMAYLGCELGNHSYDHAYFTGLSDSSISSQISRTSSAIKSASGQKPTVCRLPYGDGAQNSRVLSNLGLPSIYWSIDTRDWANTGNPQHTVNEVLNNVKSGDIILMHDIHYSTVSAAETIIPALKKRGYQLVTVSQLARYKGNTTLKKGKTYYHFK